MLFCSSLFILAHSLPFHLHLAFFLLHFFNNTHASLMLHRFDLCWTWLLVCFFHYFITSLLGSLFHFFNCYVNSLFHGVIALLLCFAISFDRLVVLSFLFPSFGISFLLEYLERGCMTCNICGFVDLNNFGQGECYI